MTYKPSNSQILRVWEKFRGSSPGRWLASKALCFAAPYFSTIKPVFIRIEPGHVEARMKNRRAVHNHIKTVHAIAMCNLAELVGGTCMDVSLHADFRWIPVGMEVKYLKLAKTNLHAVCKVEDYTWEEPQDVILPVSVYDSNDVEVFQARIIMRVSARKKK